MLILSRLGVVEFGLFHLWMGNHGLNSNQCRLNSQMFERKFSFNCHVYCRLSIWLVFQLLNLSFSLICYLRGVYCSIQGSSLYCFLVGLSILINTCNTSWDHTFGPDIGLIAPLQMTNGKIPQRIFGVAYRHIHYMYPKRNNNRLTL